MRLINPHFVIENPEELDEVRVLARLERYGRTAYQSEGSVGAVFIRKIIDRGHESVIEHEKITIRFVCDRGVTHEVVRHRIASYTQESTRFCNYAQGRFGSKISVIKPLFFDRDGVRKTVDVPNGVVRDPYASFGVFLAEMGVHDLLNEFDVWCLAMSFAEWAYLTLINDFGRTPQEARSVLPNSLKTEIVVTYNLREWRHFLRLRCARNAHPQMREIAVPLLWEFQRRMPTIFGDIPIPE